MYLPSDVKEQNLVLPICHPDFWARLIAHGSDVIPSASMVQAWYLVLERRADF